INDSGYYATHVAVAIDANRPTHITESAGVHSIAVHGDLLYESYLHSGGYNLRKFSEDNISPECSCDFEAGVLPLPCMATDNRSEDVDGDGLLDPNEDTLVPNHILDIDE